MKPKDIARVYVRDHFEDLQEGRISKKKLAKMIIEDHPGLYANLESARRMIREITGQGGRAPAVGDEDLVFKSNIEHGRKYLSLPQTHADPVPDFIFPDYKKTFVFSDVHIPYHNEQALLLAIEYAKKEEVDSILINGDLIDFYQGSDFVRDPRNMDIGSELKIAQDFMAYLKQELPVPVFYKLGNHEYRYERYLLKNAKELLGIDAFNIENVLNLDCTIIKQDQLIKYGKLNIIHGHEFKQSFFNPVNPARGLFLRAKSNTLAGHLHQTSEHAESNINGDNIVCHSIGCLCDLRPEYSRFAYVKWNHGFAIATKDDDGFFTVQNKKIVRGKIV